MQRKRKLVGVALGSGGMRGIAHIGILQVLEEAGIPIDFVSGASVGAFVGAAYAAEMDLYALGRFAVKLRRRDVLDPPNPFRAGVFSGRKFQKLCALVTDNRSFSETCVPFWCSAVDLKTGETRYLHEGSLSEAVRASIAIPGLLRPVASGGTTYVDGGTVESIPAEILRCGWPHLCGLPGDPGNQADSSGDGCLELSQSEDRSVPVRWDRVRT